MCVSVCLYANIYNIVYMYAIIYIYIHEGMSKSNAFFFNTGIITNTGTCIIHQNIYAACCPEDLPRAMNDREEWRERVRDIRAASTI